MMVEALVRPIVHHHRQIEIVGADPHAPALVEIVAGDAAFDVAPGEDVRGGGIGDGDRRRTGRAAETFLQTPGDDVDTPAGTVAPLATWRLPAGADPGAVTQI